MTNDLHGKFTVHSDIFLKGLSKSTTFVSQLTDVQVRIRTGNLSNTRKKCYCVALYGRVIINCQSGLYERRGQSLAVTVEHEEHKNL